MPSDGHVESGASRKRKLTDGIDAPASRRRTSRSQAAPEPKPTNHLLACYLAHEFLTRGTLLGSSFRRPEVEPTAKAEQPHPRQAYADVACLLKGDGVHLPGIVNPSQLARWVGIDT
uniref:Uncharacterized protein n=1 Tax=Nymphaea colorata TaxID=210225 RepID=A0A5K0YSZ4_9MAGN|nr:unnamed protein product [Nymphaea colorata]